MDESEATSSAAPNPMATMFRKASIKEVKGNEFNNTARDTMKFVWNNYNFTREDEKLMLDSSDTIDHLLKVVPFFLAELRKAGSETTGTDSSDQANQGPSAVTSSDHNLEGHLVDIIDMIPPEPSTLPVTSVADRYTRSMLKCLAGYPLYTPKPFSDLSKEYPRNGVNIGDVGYVRGDGCFDFLFNICPSKNETINPPNLPDGFSLEKPHQSATRDLEPLPSKTSLFQTPITITDSGEYICEGSEGAILELPEGAMLDEARRTFPFKNLAARHGVQWYEYTMAQGSAISNGSLYLITSSTKCTQWGNAVFDRSCVPGQGLRFSKKISFLYGKSAARYQWKGSRVFPTKVSNPNKGDTANQCVFVKGYKIMIRQDIFDNLYEEQLRGSDTTMPSSSRQEGSSSQTEKRQRATRIRGGGGPDPMLKIQESTDSSLLSPSRMPTTTKSDEVVFHTDLNSLLVHPSDLFNAALLSQNPNTKVALTHDDVWCSLLRDNFPKLDYVSLINIARSYTIAIDEYDCISLQKISDSSNVLDQSSSLLPADYTPASSLIPWTLSRELVERILFLLDTNAIIRCRLVNRRFNEIILSSFALRYLLACKAAGVIDNPSLPLFYLERLAVLLEQEVAWRNLRPVFETTIKINHQPSLIYGLTAGTYFLADSNKKDLHYCQLPSAPQYNPQWIRMETNASQEGTFVNFATAIYEHDLIIKFVSSSEVGNQTDTQRHSLDLILLKFSTGEYHPLARDPRIHVQSSPSAGFDVSPDIVGDNVALVVHSFDVELPERLFIFDWKSGHKRLQHETSEDAYSDLVFLSAEILLVPNLVQYHFEVWYLPPSDPDPTPPVQILALQIPSISPRYSLIGITCDGKPNPFLHSMPYLPQRAFFPSPENSIIVTNLRLLLTSAPPKHGQQLVSYTLIVHRHTLLDTIKELWALPSLAAQQGDLPLWNEVTVHNTADPEDGSVRLCAESKSVLPSSQTYDALASPPPFSSISSDLSTTSSLSRYSFLEVEWVDWGPPISRWFHIKEIKTQYMTSFGQRCAFLLPNPDDDKKTMVTVMDFNPHSVRRTAEMEMRFRGKREDNSNNGNNEDEYEEDKMEILDHRRVFSEEVRMGLKCVVYHAPYYAYDFDQLLMDEERLLGLKLDSDEKVESIKALYFG